MEDTNEIDMQELNKITLHAMNNTDVNVENNEGITRYTEANTEPFVETRKLRDQDDNNKCSFHKSDTSELPAIPDGGWGWVVAVSAFIITACTSIVRDSTRSLLIQGTSTMFGTDKFFILGVFNMTYLITAPLMSALVDRYGCRTMTMIASILSTIGFLLGAVSNTMGMFCLTVGFLSSLAMSILYLTPILAVTFWFEKRRNLIIAFIFCASPITMFISSLISSYVLDVYFWRSSILILAGILLNTCVGGALLKNPEWLGVKQKRERRARLRRNSKQNPIFSRPIGADSTFLYPGELKRLLKQGKSLDNILDAIATCESEATRSVANGKLNAQQQIKQMHSAIHLPTFVQHNEKVPTEVINKMMRNRQLYNILSENQPDILCRTLSDTSINIVNSDRNRLRNEIHKTEADKLNQPHNTEICGMNAIVENAQHNINMDPTLLGSNTLCVNNAHSELREDACAIGWHIAEPRGAIKSITSKYRLRAQLLPAGIYKHSPSPPNPKSSDEFHWYDGVWQAVVKTFNLNMFTEFHFLMFYLIYFTLAAWDITPFFIMYHMMKSNDDAIGTYFIIIRISFIFGLLILGWLGDQHRVNITKTFAICLMVCGISIAVLPFATHNTGLAVIPVVFGLSSASLKIYTPAMLLKLMPLDQFIAAYGFILLNQAVANNIGPLLTYLVNGGDITEISFCITGVVFVVCGVCVSVIEYTNNVRICGKAPLMKDAEQTNKQ